MKILILLAIVIISGSQAFAADNILSCTLGSPVNPQGKAKINLHEIPGRPDLALMEIELVSKVSINGQAGVAHLQGLLGTAINQRSGNIIATGVLFNSGTGATIINPGSVTLQGSLANFSGRKLLLQLLDQNRILQHGFGVALDCEEK
jgi:hypothetical protein